MSADHRIVVGDCLDPATGLASLPDRSVDHFITDPPYSEKVHFKSVRGTGHRAGGRIQDLGFEHLDAETMQSVSGQIGRVVKRWGLVFSDVESAHLWRAALVSAARLEHIRCGLWVKGCPTPQMTGDRPAAGAEAITVVHPQGRKRWNGGGKAGVWHCDTAYRSGDEMSHTTQKPLALMEALIRDFTDPGDLVCDPFAGSGTTGVACKRLGRRFLGWERNPEWAAAAQKRIDEAREQLGLFAGPMLRREKNAELFP